jgi:hypothetical protein
MALHRTAAAGRRVQRTSTEIRGCRRSYRKPARVSPPCRSGGSREPRRFALTDAHRARSSSVRGCRRSYRKPARVSPPCRSGGSREPHRCELSICATGGRSTRSSRGLHGLGAAWQNATPFQNRRLIVSHTRTLFTVLLAALLGGGCAVVAVADAAVSVAAGAVSVAATVIETGVDVAAAGVEAVVGDDKDEDGE